MKQTPWAGDTAERLSGRRASHPIWSSEQMPEGSTKKKDEYLKLLSEVGPRTQSLEALGQRIAKDARFMQDIATPLHDLVSQIPAMHSLPKCGLAKSRVCMLGTAAQTRFIEARPDVNSFHANSSGTVNTTSAAFTYPSGWLSIPAPQSSSL